MTSPERESTSARDGASLGPIDEEGFLQELVDATTDGLLAIDAESTVVFANPAVEEIFGYAPEELVGRSLTVLMPEPHRSAHLDAIDRYIETDERQLDWDAVSLTGLHASGKEVPIEVSFRERRRNGQRLFIGIVRDVTERRAHRRGLERERDELRSELDGILDRISDAFFAVDDDWRITYVNDRAEAVLEREAAELVGADLWERFPDAVDSRFQVAYERAMADQEPATFEAFYAPLDTWFEVNAYPSESGLSVYFRDVTERKEHESTLRALHSMTQDLLRAGSVEEVGDLAVETASGALDPTAVAIYHFDPDENALVPLARDPALEDAIGELPTYEPGAGVVGEVFVDGTESVREESRGGEPAFGEDAPTRAEFVVPLGDRGVVVAASMARGRLDGRTRELVRSLATAVETALERFERERELRERDRRLQEQNRELAELNRLNRIIRRIDQSLVDASTRGEIEAAVCEHLVEAEAHEFAWIGEPDAAGRSITPRSWAGESEGYLDALAALWDDGRADEEPAIAAARDEEPVAVGRVAEGFREEPWRREAVTRGFQSVVAVPLPYDGFSYGVLAVCASEPDAFEGETLTVFEELGSAIANGLNAIETKEGLRFDRIVELDIRIPDPNDALHGIAAGTGGAIQIEGVIPQSDASLAFFSASGVDPEAVRSRAADQVAIDRIRLVSADEETCLFEAAVAEDLVGASIVDHGGVPRSVSTDGNVVRAVVDLPHTADVREFFERLRTDYPDAELVAKRERERTVETRLGFRGELEERLTDRQLEVLRTAYLSGYFEEPRQSSGRELGAALDISQPTFNAHLRAAQRRLLGLLFDSP